MLTLIAILTIWMIWMIFQTPPTCQKFLLYTEQFNDRTSDFLYPPVRWWRFLTLYARFSHIYQKTIIKNTLKSRKNASWGNKFSPSKSIKIQHFPGLRPLTPWGLQVPRPPRYSDIICNTFHLNIIGGMKTTYHRYRSLWKDIRILYLLYNIPTSSTSFSFPVCRFVRSHRRRHLRSRCASLTRRKFKAYTKYDKNLF